MTRGRLVAVPLVVVALLLAGCGPGAGEEQAPHPPAPVGSPVSAAAAGSAQPAAVAPVPTTRAAAKTPGGVTPGTGLSAFTSARVHWRACTASFAAADYVDLRGYQCATVAVPLDYAHPSGRRLAIAIARLPASGGHRIGSLLINPGGPGVSGLGYLKAARVAIPAAVRARFDVVGFDPRGVGASAGLHCLATSGFDAMVAAVPPVGRAQVAAAVARDKALADGCRRTAGWELPYLGTVNAARDLDLIRSAVGDAQLTYLGKSYGTLLGAVYADEFPSRVRALVLDGALPPDLDPADQARQQGDAFESELTAFLADCVRRSGCPWSGTATQARAGLDGLLRSVAARPLRTSDGSRTLQVGQAVNGLSAALYATSRWSRLRSSLAEARRGDGSGLLVLSDGLSGRHEAGYESVAGAFPAISCMDVPTSYTTAQVAGLARQWARRAPLFGPMEAWSLLDCNGWVPSASRLPARVRAAGAAPIVVVGTTGDPATPYAWAQDLAAELAGARLITYRGEGHTVYGGGRSPCVDRAVDDYLIHLTPPAAGLRCG